MFQSHSTSSGSYRVNRNNNSNLPFLPRGVSFCKNVRTYLPMMNRSTRVHAETLETIPNRKTITIRVDGTQHRLLLHILGLAIMLILNGHLRNRKGDPSPLAPLPRPSAELPQNFDFGILGWMSVIRSVTNTLVMYPSVHRPFDKFSNFASSWQIFSKKRKRQHQHKQNQLFVVVVVLSQNNPYNSRFKAW